MCTDVLRDVTTGACDGLPAGLAAGVFTGLVLLPAGVAAQAEFPNRRIHIVLPYPAGGIVDITTRIVTDNLAELWRQPFVIEAKPTASGNVAWDQVEAGGESK